MIGIVNKLKYFLVNSKIIVFNYSLKLNQWYGVTDLVSDSVLADTIVTL